MEGGVCFLNVVTCFSIAGLIGMSKETRETPKQIGGLRATASLRHRRYNHSRSSSGSTPGLPKPLGMRRKYPNGKSVILRASAQQITRVKNRKHTKKMKNKHRYVCDGKRLLSFTPPYYGTEAVNPIVMAISESKFC